MSNLSDFIGADPQAIVKVTAGGAITAGDLLANSESGVALTVSAALSIATENNTVAGLGALYPPTDQAGSGANWGRGSSGGRVRNIIELGNGTLAHIYSGNGSGSNTAGLTLKLKAMSGTDLASVMVSAATTINDYRIQKINATTFAVAWVESTTLKFAVYSNAGAVIAAPTVATLSGPQVYLFNMDVAANGDIVFAYSKDTSLNCAFSRYSAAGVLQGTEVTVDAAAAPQGICVCPVAAGGFVIYYARSAATAGYKFARYDATGALQGALVTVLAVAPVLTGVGGNYENLCIELAGGNIVMQVRAADTYFDLYVYSAAGALVKLIDLGTADFLAGEVLSIAAIIGGFSVAGRDKNTGQNFRTFNTDGAALVPTTAVGAASAYTNLGAGGGSGTITIPLGTAGFAVLTIGRNSTNPNEDVRLACFSPTGIAVGSNIAVLAANNTGLIDVWAMLTSGGHLVITYQRGTNSGPMLAIYKCQRKSLLGVAIDTVARGALCRIGTKGSYNVNGNYAYGGNFDVRANVIPGAKGAVIGQTAQLFGLA